MKRQHGYQLQQLYPEVAAGGFTRVDGTIAFFIRVNALVTPDSQVLDFGAGRGEWMEDELSPYRKRLRNLRGKAAMVIGADVDPAVRGNGSLDHAVVIHPDDRLPWDDGTFDVIVADWTFEHIQRAELVSSELARICKPDGWVCARTPNKYGYVALLTNMIPNRYHASVLRHAQPRRQAVDIFPTVYRMNTRKRLSHLFPGFKQATFVHTPEPSYAADSIPVTRFLRLADGLLPTAVGSTLHVFMQKPEKTRSITQRQPQLS